jgi:hypothetical protein
MKQIISLISFFLFSSLVLAQQVPQLQRSFPFRTNGTINVMERDLKNNRIIIGGNFTSISLSYNVKYGAMLDTVTEVLNVSLQAPNNKVLTSITDGKGGVFIGGGFTQVGDSVRNGIAHIDSTGKVTAWNPNANDTVRTLAISGNTIYVGGDFSNIGGQPRSYIAAIDATTGSATAWNPNSNGKVNLVVESGNRIYACGTFYNIGGQARNVIAALDLNTGNATTWNPNPNSASGLVNALVVSGNTIYVGGTFTIIGGQNRSKIAALDTSSGNVTSWNPPNIYGGDVATLAVSGNKVYAGGDFTLVGAQARSYIAAFDVTTGNLTPWNSPNINGKVNTLAISGNTIYAGGKFSKKIITLNINTGNIINGKNIIDGGDVYTLTILGNKIYIGGDFTMITTQTYSRVNMAAIDVNTNAVTAWRPTPNGAIHALAVSGDTIFLGGEFTMVGGVITSRIAAIDAGTGNPLNWHVQAAGGNVYALAKAGKRIYAGGSFTSMGGQQRRRISQLDSIASQYNVYTENVTSWNPNANGTVRTLVLAGNTLYVGGGFDTIGGQARKYIAAFDINTGNITSWNPNADGIVNVLVTSNNTIYAGGQFTSIGGQIRSRIAALDASTGNATAWNPNANGQYGNRVYTLASSGNTVYAGGEFDSIGGKARYKIAALDASTGNATDWFLDTEYNIYEVSSILASGKMLYVSFFVDGSNNSYLAIFKSENFVSKTDTICEGTLYSFNGTNLTTGGIYKDTLTNSYGGDSIVTLSLTVIPRSLHTINAATCYSYSFKGLTLTDSGIYKDTLTNSIGCDSIVTLNLSIKQRTASTQNVSACKSYHFKDSTLTLNGTYKDTIPNSYGCDSIITLNLTINQPSANSLNISVCKSYTFKAKIYTADTIFTDTITNVRGCDSIIIIHLRIKQPSGSTHAASICAGNSYTFNDKTYTASGTYNDTIPNAQGCDSVITLNLTVNSSPNPIVTRAGNILSTTAFSSYQWLKDNAALSGATSQTYTVTASGNYSVSVTNANTCSDTSNVINIDFTSINDISKKAFRIYPNPTKGELNITAMQNATIQIFSMHGQEIYKETMQNETLLLNLNKVVKGLYFVRLTAMSGEILIRKVVVE